jgi:hypothetical protein
MLILSTFSVEFLLRTASSFNQNAVSKIQQFNLLCSVSVYTPWESDFQAESGH